MEIFGYILIGVFCFIMSACAITPVVLDSMPKEEREAAGIICKED